MIHITVATLLVFLALTLGYTLLVALLRALVVYVEQVIELVVALVFFLLVVPSVWLWVKARRPMWRTLSKEQTRELEVWLRRGVGR